ncbi:unnamed protein product, partial [Symbiodinium microadriaticum]
CEDWEPRWFCVVYEPQVAVRKKPPLQAHPVAFLKTEEMHHVTRRWFLQVFSLKQAFGLRYEARAMLEENDSKAELRVKEARKLAQKSFEEALADDDELVSKSSLRARRAWRPLRDTEKEEVQKKRTAVQEEAQQILNVCTLLDEEECRSLLLKQQLCGKWDVVDVSGTTA